MEAHFKAKHGGYYQDSSGVRLCVGCGERREYGHACARFLPDDASMDDARTDLEAAGRARAADSPGKGRRAAAARAACTTPQELLAYVRRLACSSASVARAAALEQEVERTAPPARRRGEGTARRDKILWLAAALLREVYDPRGLIPSDSMYNKPGQLDEYREAYADHARSSRRSGKAQ